MTKANKKVKVVIVGAGARGTCYADLLGDMPDQAEVVGVAEPREFFRERLARKHKIPAANVFTTWEDMAAVPKFADAAIIGTQDRMHLEPMRAYAGKGYHILLEKPMAPNAADCREIAALAKRHKVIFSVCHVLRYTDYTTALKRVVDSGVLGEIVSMQHLEPVGYWHFAHSFVRGNWRNETESSFMLLAKSCHDLDWIRHIMGRPCTAVSSFGSLQHFTAANRPAGAADRCLDCAVEATCPYSAVRYYGERLRTGKHGWPLDVITSDMTEAGVAKALREGPYGRCVYACDNDVVDHQVVNLEFAGGATASFSMVGCTGSRPRETFIFGSRGELHGDSHTIKVFDYTTNKLTETDTRTGDTTLLGGHGGGDGRIITNFVEAVAANDPTKVISGPDVSLETHLMVFAAEAARRQGRVIRMSEF